jgi:GNAT superfamily N-acetyltransferase
MRLESEENVTIDWATLEDVPELVEMLLTLFEQEEEFKPCPERHRCALEMIVSNPERGRILVARRQRRVIGMVSLLDTVSTAEGGIAVLLEDFVVTPSSRGQGVGTTLMQAALAYCKDRRVVRITLLTDRDNARAQRFYVRFGFFISPMIPLRCFPS